MLAPPRQDAAVAPPATVRRSRRPIIGRAAIALGAGAAVAAAFPPYDQVWLMPIGLAALMVLLYRRDLSAGLGYGWLFGFAFVLVLMPWLRVIGSDAWIALAVIEGSFYGLMGLSWAAVSRHRWWPAAAAAAWVGAELLRATVPFGGLPWGRLAFGLVDTPLDRYGRLGGTALVSFVVVSCIALLVDVGMRRAWSWRGLVQAGAALGVAAASLALPVGLDGASGTVRVAAVQGNVPGEGLNAFAQRWAVLRNHAHATEAFAASVESGTAARPHFVIWPENSTDIDPFSDPAAYRAIQRAVDAVGVPVLVGAVVDGPDPDHVQNVGIVWSPTTGPGQRYVKQHLVPFGEYIPFRSVLTRFIGRLQEIPKDFSPGHRVGVLDIGGTRIGDLICFEVADDGLARSIVDGGGRVIVVQTNNATYAGTGQLDQQFAISRYRAIEAGRQVVVASTDGISGVFAGDGSVQARTGVHQQAVLDREVRLADGITLGVRVGGWLDVALAVAASIATVLALGMRRRAGRMS